MEKTEKSITPKYRDAKIIAEGTGYSESLVRKALDGRRNNPKIKKAEQIVIANRRILKGLLEKLGKSNNSAA